MKHAITQIKAINEGEGVRWLCTCGDGGTCDSEAAWITMSRHLTDAELKAVKTRAVPTGIPVRVYAPDSDLMLFTGHETPGAARWAGWRRVVPDNGHIDLPPRFRIELQP